MKPWYQFAKGGYKPVHYFTMGQSVNYDYHRVCTNEEICVAMVLNGLEKIGWKLTFGTC
jgi:hypothetical protein